MNWKIPNPANRVILVLFLVLVTGTAAQAINITRAETYEDWIDPDEVEQIEVLISSPSYVSIASIAGHILLVIRKKGEIEGLSTVVSFVARAVNKKGRNDGGLAYALRGIFGYYDSVLQIETLSDVILRQNIKENRDIYRLKLNLDNRGVRRLIQRLWEINRSFHSKYYFFNRNCTSMFLDLLDDVLPPGKRVRDRNAIDLPLNAGSEIFLKGIAEFVYPEYWSISRQAKFSSMQNRRIEKEVLRYIGESVGREAAHEMEGYFKETLSPDKNVRMEAYKKISSLYAALGDKPSEENVYCGGEFHLYGKLLLKYFMNAKNRETYLDVVRAKKDGEKSVPGAGGDISPGMVSLVTIILKLRGELGKHIHDDVFPLYDEIEDEITRYVVNQRKKRAFNCGYSQLFVSPRLNLFNGGSFQGGGFGYSTIFQKMGDTSVFSLGADTHLEFFTLGLGMERRSENVFLDVGFRFLDFDKVLVSGSADYDGWFNLGLGLTLFDTFSRKGEGLRWDVTVLNLRGILNIFERGNFTDYCNVVLGLGYSYRKDVGERTRHFLDVVCGLSGKFHLFGNSRNALRFDISYRPRINFTSRYISESGVKVEMDWDLGAYSNALLTTGVSYGFDRYRLGVVPLYTDSHERWSFYTTLRFKISGQAK